MELPFSHVRHLTLLEVIVQLAKILQQQVTEGGDAWCGTEEALVKLAKLIDPDGSVILTPDQRNIIPNPKLFSLLPVSELTEDMANFYQLEVQSWYDRMKEVYPGDLVK